jgi:peptidoglycan/LPS O-acetylase OafA/YrhL
MSSPGPSVRGTALPLAAIVSAVGGALAVVQAALVWEQVAVGPAFRSAFVVMGLDLPTSANGIEENGGKIVLALGAVALAVTAAWIMKAKVPSLPVLMIVVGGLITVVAAANWVARTNDVSDFNDQMAEIKALVDTTGTTYSVGMGIYVAIAGGVIVAIGGLLGLLHKEA